MSVFYFEFGCLEGVTRVDDDFSSQINSLEIAEQVSEGTKHIREYDDEWRRYSIGIAGTRHFT